MTTSYSQSLAEIVTKNFKAASVFEKYNLDYCCKGKRSLADACNERSLNPEKILEELSEIDTSISNQFSYPFEKLTLAQLIDHIQENHHQFVRRELAQIPVYLEKIVSKHGTRHPELVEIFELFKKLKTELLVHLQDEEDAVFPKIIALEKLNFKVPDNSFQAILSPELSLKKLEKDHDEAGEIMAIIRALSDDYTPPPDACTTYKLAFAALKAFEIDLHHHVHLENNILMPKAMSLYRSIADA